MLTSKRIITVLAALLLGSFVGAAPASAGERWTYAIAAFGEGGFGGGEATGGFTFIDADEIHNIDMTLKDLCPEDNEDVYVKIVMYNSGGPGYPDGTNEELKHTNSSGCGTTQSWMNQAWGDSWVERQATGTIYRARMKVCVKEMDVDECKYSYWRDNPYSNDPSKSGM